MQLLIRAYAIYLVQGPFILEKKVLDYCLSRGLHIRVANDIVPVIEKESKRIQYNTYIDIGAHTGDTLLPAAHLVRNCIAVEPDPRNLPLLIRVTQNQNLKNCIIVDCALSDSVGQMPMFVSKRTDLSSLYAKSRDKILVKLDTLDNLVQKFGLKPPFLVKMDVQGGEYHVLLGGAKTLTNQTTILSEFWPYGLVQSGANPLHLIDMMTSKGFTVFSLCGRVINREKLIRFIKLGSTNPDISTDLIFRNF